MTAALGGSVQPASAGATLPKEQRPMQNMSSLSQAIRWFPRRRQASTPTSYPVVGASVGLVTFLFVGLLPSLLFGGSVAAQVAMEAAPASHGYGFNAFLLLGVLVATFIGALLFAALGAAAGAALGALTWVRTPRRAGP